MRARVQVTPASRRRKASVRLFQTLGVEAEFLGHLDQLLGSFGILDGFGQAFGPVGLVSVVISLGHGSTFQRYVPTAPKRFEPAVQVSNSCSEADRAFEPPPIRRVKCSQRQRKSQKENQMQGVTG